LIEGVVTGLLDKRPALTKATQGVKDLFRRIDWLKVAKHAGGLAFFIVRKVCWRPLMPTKFPPNKFKREVIALHGVNGALANWGDNTPKNQVAQRKPS
jgi:hypothetical protein